MSSPSTPPSSRPHGLIALSAVLAVLLVAALIVIAVLLMNDDDEVGRSADDLADATCERVRALPNPIDFDDLGLEEPLAWELQAVSSLATAAGVADDRYEALKEAGEQVYVGIQRYSQELVDQGFDDLLDECE